MKDSLKIASIVLSLMAVSAAATSGKTTAVRQNKTGHGATAAVSKPAKKHASGTRKAGKASVGEASRQAKNEIGSEDHGSRVENRGRLTAASHAKSHPAQKHATSDRHGIHVAAAPHSAAPRVASVHQASSHQASPHKRAVVKTASSSSSQPTATLKTSQMTSSQASRSQPRNAALGRETHSSPKKGASKTPPAAVPAPTSSPANSPSLKEHNARMF